MCISNSGAQQGQCRGWWKGGPAWSSSQYPCSKCASSLCICDLIFVPTWLWHCISGYFPKQCDALTTKFYHFSNNSSWSCFSLSAMSHLHTFSSFSHDRPPEAPPKVCPDFRRFEGLKIALSLSGDRRFEAFGLEFFWISCANRLNLVQLATARRGL